VVNFTTGRIIPVDNNKQEDGVDPRTSLTLWRGKKAISSARNSTVNPQSPNNFLQLRTSSLIPTSL